MSNTSRDVRDVPDRKPSDELLKPDAEHRSFSFHDVSEGEAAAVDERRLLRKIDLHLLPTLSLLYLLSFLDRTNMCVVQEPPRLTIPAAMPRSSTCKSTCGSRAWSILRPSRSSLPSTVRRPALWAG